MKRFQRVAVWAAAIVALLLAVFIGWGLLEPRLLDEQHIDARVPNLPAHWRGARIAVLGDFQIGIWLDNPGTVEEAVDEILSEPPAAVLLLGDFVYHDLEDAERQTAEVERLLRPLADAGVPMFAVLGNHDWSVAKRGQPPSEEMAERVRRMLRDLGVRVLENDRAVLPSPGGEPIAERGAGRASESLFVVGLGSDWAERDEPSAPAEMPSDAARLVIMHNPRSFRSIPAGAAPVAFAGHTHGGQVRLPFTESWSWLQWALPGAIPVDGWVDESWGATGNALYVNRGIGMGGVPIRIRCRPELTIVTLQSD